ncbi:MAG: hypothetical protein HQM09_19130 [Candidatus Riflebacteria bacterium]|nr:hypothetical protein [Candidatus Riflebacteria bacterium]
MSPEEKLVAKTLAESLKMDFIDLETAPLEEFQGCALIPVPMMKSKCVALLNIDMVEKKMTVAMAEPNNADTIMFLEMMTGMKMTPVVATKAGISRAISICFESPVEHQTQLLHKLDSIAVKASSEKEVSFADDSLEQMLGDLGENDAPIVRLINLILTNIVFKHASEALVEPTPTKLLLKVGSGDAWETIKELPIGCYDPLVRRLRLMADWPFDKPSEGESQRFRFMQDNQAFFFRIINSSTPSGKEIHILRVE